MLQRHLPAQQFAAPIKGIADAKRAIDLGTPISLWKIVHRDKDFLQRSPQVIERLARHLQAQGPSARLRSEQAEEMKLTDLAAADKWWKRQWQQKTSNGSK